MTEYSFEPDYRVWWNRSDLTESDLVWLMLAINPEDAQKSGDLKSKSDFSHEEMLWKSAFSSYLHGLFNGPWITDSRNQLMNEKLWGQGKGDFIVNAYGRSVKFPEPFADFLKLIGVMPDHFDHYKNHDFYRDSFNDWKLEDIDSEDKAISLLLGIKPEIFQRYCFLAEALKPNDAWENACPDDRHFFLEFGRFNASEFSLDQMQYGVLPGFAEKIKRLGLWKGDFAAYVQAVHDGGFVFKRKTYEALEFHGIKPVYTRDGWARSFYRSWIERGVWRTKEAALLYLGDDPHGGRGFHGFGETERRGPGRVLQRFDSVIFLQVDQSGQWIDHPVDRLEEETSLEAFVKNHMLAGSLTPASTDDGLKFRPLEIVSFFRKYFSLTFEPQALLIELGLEGEEAETELQPYPMDTGFPGRPAKGKHIIEREFERRKQQGIVAGTLAEEARQLRAWFIGTYPDLQPPTVKVTENNIRAVYNQHKADKWAA